MTAAGDFDFDGEETVEGQEKSHELVEISNFKGNPTISLRRKATDQYPFSFGLTKAKLILDNIEAIEEFVRDNSKR